MRLRQITRWFPVIAVCTTLGPAVSGESPASGLSARQLYYKKPTATPGPANTSQATPEDPKSLKKSSGLVKKKSNPKGNPTDGPAKTTGAESTENPNRQNSGQSAEEQPQSHEVELARLGLRYSVLMGSNEVDSKQSFRSDDHFRLKLTPNEAAYLYVLIRQSQGNWDALFPSPKIANNNNYVAAGQEIVIPGEQEFYFDDHTGEETLFVVLSRQPVPDVDQLLDSLRRQSEPGAAPTIAHKSDTVLSQNVSSSGIGNDQVQKVRTQLTSRGILIDSNPRQAPGYKAEKAVYVVAAPDLMGRLVADIVLKHR